MKKVLITADHQERNNPDPLIYGPWSIVTDYEVFPVLNSGLLPYLLPAVLFSEHELEEILKPIDIVFLTGGLDVSPIFYGEEVHYPNVKRYSIRDQLELRLIEVAVKMKKTIFGVCRGFQILNVYFGGTLYQDLPSELKSNISHRFDVVDFGSLSHKVKISSESFLSKIYKEKEIWTNSFHHQGVRKLGKGLKIAAKTGDGLIEAFEHEELRVYGVQWHPEISFHFDDNSKKIFEFLK